MNIQYVSFITNNLFALFCLLIVNLSVVQAEPITVDHVRGALEWAKAQGTLDQPLYLFITGHAAPDKIQLDKLSYLESAELKSMLDDYQTATGNELIIVIDAPYAGSFVKSLAASKRAVISSTTEDGLAYFVEKQGFNLFFTDNLHRGMNLFEAFELASQRQERKLGKLMLLGVGGEAIQARQVPQLDDDGDGIFTDNDGQWLRQIYIVGDNLVHASNDKTNSLLNTAKSISERTFRMFSDLILGSEVFASTIKRSTRSGKHAAIIIAAGGNNKTNSLWDTTESISNYTYKMFYNRGFDHEKIYYLSSASWADFNGDGINDNIVDAPKVSSEYEDPEVDAVESIKGAAIIIAGGGNQSSNPLWDTTESIANNTYRVLHEGGFLNKQIYYLSPKPWADINGDGNDDHIVDAPKPERPLTVNDIRDALTWAKTRGKLDQPLYLFFVDHGGPDKLQIAKNTQMGANEFKAILDDYQNSTGNELILVIDASYSGSFLESLANPGRTIISSSSATELAYFDVTDKTGFCHFFASNLHKGMSFYDAFEYARDEQNKMVNPIFEVVQTPQLDDNGDGLFTDADGQWLRHIYLDHRTDVAITIEALTTSTTLQAGQEFLLKSRIQGPIKRAWVEIEIDRNFQTAKQLELSQATEENIWETTWKETFYNGGYQVTFYAENLQGSTVNSGKPVTIQVINGLEPPQQRLAIVIAGGGNHQSNGLWDDTESISNYIYNMLHERKFTDKEIYYLTPELGADFDGDGINDHVVDTPSPGQPLTIDDIHAAMKWAKEHGTLGQPLYLFFTGHGSRAKDGRLQLAKLEYLLTSTLKELLDEYQNTTSNQVILFIDACYSGVWVEQLKAPNRAIISSSNPNELAIFYDKKSFNRFLAKFLISGTTVFEAFDLARDEQRKMIGSQTRTDNVEDISLNQTPLLDDNGDGISNSNDGRWLKKLRIGHRIESGSLIVEVEGVTQSTTLQVGQPLTLKAKADTDTESATQVWALIRPPKMNLVLDTNGTPILGFQRLDLSHTKDILWEGIWSDAVYNGDYEINFYAQDKQGNIASSDKSIIINVTGGVEPPEKANLQIVLEKDRYRPGEPLKAELIENLGWGYDLYAAVVMPDGHFIAFKNTNQFSPVNEAKKWRGQRAQNSHTTLVDFTLPEGLPTGEYCLYGILSPEREDVFETLALDLWVMEQRCFEVY
ncbi:C13 family peptidase [Candidatus Marithioploca araucensis]|uniref:C13 family peptidase n=1 Tax=Candidatus Marithioploca araucensis TaxID=70273 RepID=A0ABT7VS42_9GAMM|nr:C13 family peptidase [Candidatus Marithioploca araucensis]